jgi:hypothetical protein
MVVGAPACWAKLKVQMAKKANNSKVFLIFSCLVSLKIKVI